MKYLLFVSLLAIALPATAQQVVICSLFGDLAENVMKIRQKGASPAFVLKALLGNDEMINKIVVSLMADAYSKPRYTTERFQIRAVVDFRSEVETACLFN